MIIAELKYKIGQEYYEEHVYIL